MENQNDFVIERVFNAPRETVWKAWTEPEMVKKWWGPAGFSAPSAKVDLRVGGMYTFAMHGPAGTEWDKDMYSSGIYKEIVPMEKIVTTDYFSDENGNKIAPTKEGQAPDFPNEMTVTILFKDAEDGKTKLSIAYSRPESDAQFEAMIKSGMQEGWNQSLDKLAAALQ
jgi:uncharacterized protein YndB with AHSA1/START domain